MFNLSQLARTSRKIPLKSRMREFVGPEVYRACLILKWLCQGNHSPMNNARKLFKERTYFDYYGFNKKSKEL